MDSRQTVKQGNSEIMDACQEGVVGLNITAESLIILLVVQVVLLLVVT